MSIYSFYENTYKKINNSSALSKFMSDIQIKELNSCFDVCKSIDKNIILLSLCLENTSYMDSIKCNAYDQIVAIINDDIFSNKEFNTELANQLMNYNIDIMCFNEFRLYNSCYKFELRCDNYIMASYNMDEISNILNNTVLNFTEIIYKNIYKNKIISEVFDNFKDMTNARIELLDSMCVIYPNINNKNICISIEYDKIFIKEE